jgi:uncharacterized membrane protein (Fun14 family)
MKAPAKIPVPTNMHVILAVVVLYIAAVSADQQVGVIKLNDANFAEEIAHGNWLGIQCCMFPLRSSHFFI